MTSFTNGALVFRLWQFDGSGEIIAKFQYFSDATAFAAMKTSEDNHKRPDISSGYFYLAVCEAENEMKAFFPTQQQMENAAWTPNPDTTGPTPSRSI